MTRLEKQTEDDGGAKAKKFHPLVPKACLLVLRYIYNMYIMIMGRIGCGGFIYLNII